MREQFRVSVVREVTNDDGETEYVTEFEAVARTAGQLARFAPREVLDVLGGNVGGTVAADAVDTSYMTPDGPVTATSDATTEQPKRKRRTKAEIAADEAAAAREAEQLAGEPVAATTPEQPAVPVPTFENGPAISPAPAAPYNPFAQ